MATPFKELRTIDQPFSELLEIDTRSENITEAMRLNRPMGPGPAFIPIERYISREYHELEKEHLWSKVWQQAAHEDDFANIGDALPYDIVDKSYLIVRTAEDEYKAYPNACLHRGRKLRAERAKGLEEIRCVFHGWCWELDGALKQVPCAYDYTDLDREAEHLPEIPIGRWGRYIFINPDPNCEPLEEYIGDLSTQFEVFPYERRYKRAHVSKVIRANWKVVQEAFMESYHVLLTHPQGLTGGANDMCTKYDVFGNYSRAIRTGALDGSGIPEWGPLPETSGEALRHPLNGWIYEDQGDGVVRVSTPQGASGLFTAKGKWIEGDLKDANQHLCILVGGRKVEAGAFASQTVDPEVSERLVEKLGAEAGPRAVAAEAFRESLRDVIPSVADSIPDVELTSQLYLTLFPNFHPWGSFNEINYRFRPNGDNHEECIMEVMMMAPIPDDGNYTPTREIRCLEIDDDFVEAEEELGGLGPVFNQDVLNMPFVHQGMKTTARSHTRLAEYNETKIRHFHDLYGKWLKVE